VPQAGRRPALGIQEVRSRPIGRRAIRFIIDEMNDLVVPRWSVAERNAHEEGVAHTIEREAPIFLYVAMGLYRCTIVAPWIPPTSRGCIQRRRKHIGVLGVNGTNFGLDVGIRWGAAACEAPKAASPAGALPGWAYEAGLMRLAGIAVQFRQREFQDWLTRRARHDEFLTTRLRIARSSPSSACHRGEHGASDCQIRRS
jgi:hypothetical protein